MQPGVRPARNAAGGATIGNGRSRRRVFAGLYGVARQAGFTLNELILVIVIIGILAVVAIPSFKASEFRARGFADEIAAAARTAQKLAVASGCTTELQIIPPDYTVRRSCGGGGFAVVTLPWGRDGGRAPDGVSVSAASIRFYADGRSDGGGVTVGGSRSIGIGSTGHVSVDAP